MRNECNIIRDMLPLYVDNMASEDTISFVDEHLANCAVCRAALEKMKAPNALEMTASNTQNCDETPFKIFAKRWNRKKRIITLAFTVSLLTVALLGSCFVSYLTFDTANPLSAVSGLIQITFTDTAYVEIKHSPKVVLAQPGEAVLIEYMESRGFTELEGERLGALRLFTDGEEKECIMYSVNGYYSKWIWE